MDESKVQNLQIQILNNTRLLAQKEVLEGTDLVIQLDFPPYTWPKEAEQNFINYINEGRGGWIGFHHATLLGDFDGYPLWQWFSDFMGGIRFQNYIAPLADGTVIVEDKEHPVMKGVDASFVFRMTSGIRTTSLPVPMFAFWHMWTSPLIHPLPLSRWATIR